MSLINRLLPNNHRAQEPAEEHRTLSSSAFIPLPSDTYNGDLVGTHKAMSHMAVFACVRLLADTIASLPMYVYRRDADNMPQRVFPTPTLIRKPVPEMDLFQWKWMIVSTLALRGNSFHMVTGRDALGYPTALMPLHPDLVHVERRVNVLEWYDPIYRVMGERVKSADIIHIRRFTMPGEPLGLTPIQQAARAIGIGLSAEEYGYRYFRDSANPSSVLRTDQSLTPEEVELNQAQWIASNGGRRLPAVLSGGFDWKPITITPEESQFLATRSASTGDIARFFGVPPHMIGDVERSTSWGTGIEQQSLGFVTYTLMGWLTCIESSISNALPRGQFAKFDTTALLRGDQKSRYESYQLARQAGLLSVNEMRAREEMPPVPDGDGYLQPLNFAPLGFDPATVATPKTVTEGTTEGTDPAPTPAPKKPAGLEPAPPGIGARIISRYRQEHT